MSLGAHLSRPGPRSWLCPFANDSICHILGTFTSSQPLPFSPCPNAVLTSPGEDEHAHPPNPATIPYTSKSFIASAIAESHYVTTLQAGFQSYQTALLTHRPFSQTFITAEVLSITRTLVQLAHLGDIFNHLTIQASELEFEDAGGEGEAGPAVVPEEMREELALGRGWVEKHRKSLVGCHVFFKINFWLGREGVDDGVMVEEEGIVELVDERGRVDGAGVGSEEI